MRSQKVIRADGIVGRCSKQKGNWNIVRPPPYSTDHAYKFVRAACPQHFSSLAERYTRYKRSKGTPGKENEVAPKQNGTATSLERSTSILPGHVVLPACFWYVLVKFHTTCTLALLTDLDSAAPGQPDSTASLPQLRHLRFRDRKKSAHRFAFMHYQPRSENPVFVRTH